MKYLFFLSMLISAGFIFLFPVLEEKLLGLPISWTLSRIIPYLSLLILGILLGWVFYRSCFFKTKRFNVLFTLILLILPFCIGFAMRPIYQGDFTQGGEKVVRLGELNSEGVNSLVVIADPNCPYCYESIHMMNILKKRNHKMQITYVLCTTDTLATEAYKKIARAGIDFRLARDPEAISNLAQHGFPTYLFMNENEALRWSNNDIGPMALDFMETQVQY
jgi:hypothetical protein